MINLVKVLSTSADKIKRRVVKFLRYGKSDVQTSFDATPYGIDSNPVKDMIAVYAETGEKGQTVIVGYLNKNVLADVGELRLFSTDSSGGLKGYVWIRNTGVVELNGSDHDSVRYSPLDQGLQGLITKINTELGEISAGIASAGGAYTPTPVSVDISDSKNDQVKMN